MAALFHSDPLETTDFGFQSIPTAEKPGRVDAVFDSVASKYDLMNDLMSGGLHRLWKALTIMISQVRPGDKILDIASGTGDLAYRLTQKLGETGQVILLDRNQKMLCSARNRLLDAGLALNLKFIQADAEALPFPNDYFDQLMLGFGLRNMTHKEKALLEMQRVLKPGGQLLILEFSKPRSRLLNKLYDIWSDQIPKLGQWVVKDKMSYQYLVESIRRHPSPETLQQKIIKANFGHCHFYRLSGGIVALHQAWKA